MLRVILIIGELLSVSDRQIKQKTDDQNAHTIALAG